MTKKQEISSAFSKWKIYLALFFGLGISGYLLYSSLQKSEFRKVASGGTHSWTDANANGKVDLSEPKEFYPEKNGDYKRLSAIEVIRNIHWTSTTFFWIFMAMLATAGRDLAYMWRVRILTHKELTWKRSFIVIMLWEFASALSPGVLSGAAVAMFILNREKIAMGRSTAIVIITAFFDNLFYILLIPLLFLFISADFLFPDNTGSKAVEVIFWSGFGVFTTLCLLLYLSIFQFPYLLRGILSFVTRLPFLKRFRARAEKVGDEVALTAIELKSESWWFWCKTFLATIASWTSRYLVINFILQAFIQLNLLQHVQILAKQLVMWLFLRISPTPGGSGVAEYAFSELLSDFSSSAIMLAGMAILWRLISYFPYLFIGSSILPKWLRRKSGIKK